MGFDGNVFINCPFDKDYLPLLRVLLFTVVRLGFEPQIASRSVNSAEPRIQNIIRLIESSRFAIHDLSRIQAKREGEYYRLNMPFELGIDIGCQRFKGGKWKSKVCLILEAEEYRYQAAISDLSNSNIAVHKNDARSLMVAVRDWLIRAANLRAPGPDRIWSDYSDFSSYNYDELSKKGFSQTDIDQLSVPEFVEQLKTWCAKLR